MTYDLLRENISALMACGQISSQPGFPAKTPASPKPLGEIEQASLESAQDYGTMSLVWPVSYCQTESCWKTSQGSFLPDLDVFSETWPRSGMMRSGIAFPRPPLAPLTDATGSGLWPTPAARDGKDLSNTGAYASQLARKSPSMATRLQMRGAPWTAISRVYEWSMGFPLHWSANASEP